MTPCVYGHAHVSSFPFGRVRALASCRVMHAAVSSQSRFSAPWLTTTCRAYDVSRRRTLTGRRRVHCCASLELTEENVDLVLQVLQDAPLLVATVSTLSTYAAQLSALSPAGGAHRAAAVVRRERRHHG